MKIVVLAGGISTERDVSLASGCKITNALRNKGHKVALVDLFFGVHSPEKNKIFNLEELFIGKEEAVIEEYSIPVTPVTIDELYAKRNSISHKKHENKRELFGENVLELCRIADKVFIALHGGAGEDGRLQATFDLLGIKYTGSDFTSSAITMDKELTKTLIYKEIILTSAWLRFDNNIGIEEIAEAIGFPAVIKPCNGGSSIGISIANDKCELEKAIQLAKNYEGKIIIEKFIKGREFSVGILNGKALPPIEILPKQGFYDYKNKYQAGATNEICPVDLPEEKIKKVQAITEKVHKIMGLGTYSRSDFIMDDNGDFYFLEINTLPGMTPFSLIPQEAKVAGIEYEDLCEIIVNS